MEGRRVVAAHGRRSGTGRGVCHLHGPLRESVSLGITPIAGFSPVSGELAQDVPKLPGRIEVIATGHRFWREFRYSVKGEEVDKNHSRTCP